MNGRPGAAQGPAKFSEFFLKLKGRTPVQNALHRHDLVPMGPDLEVNLSESAWFTADRARELDFKKDALVVVGGGHDYAYPWIQGMVQALGPRKKVGCINIDAHFDLRTYDPVMTSGSPFRRLIEEKILKPDSLVEFGIQNQCNSEELWIYAKKNKIKTVPFEQTRKGRAVAEFKKCLSALEKKVDVVLISVDLDAMSLAVAPGVSAPQPEGFDASELYQMLELSALRKKVISLGLFELSPEQDFKDVTARLAAQSAWKFLNLKCFKKGSRS